MNIPEKIKFIFVDKHQKSIANMVVYFVVLAPKKLPYAIGPYLTNEKGEIVVLKTEVKKVVDDYLKYDKPFHIVPFDKLPNIFSVVIKNAGAMKRSWTMLLDAVAEETENLSHIDEFRKLDKYLKMDIKNKQLDESIVIEGVEINKDTIEIIVPYEFKE